MKKRSLSLVLAFAMILAMACGAWAATTTTNAMVSADALPEKTPTGDITASDDYHGLYALDAGSIVYTGGTITINASDDNFYEYGAYAYRDGKIRGTGDIKAYGTGAMGLGSNTRGDITWVGDIETNGNGDLAMGAYIVTNSSLDLTGDIATHGTSAHGMTVTNGSYVKMTGDITTDENGAMGIRVWNTDTATYDTTTVIFTGDIVADGDNTNAVAVTTDGTDVQIAGDITVNGANSNGLGIGGGGEVTMTGGTIAATDPTGYAMHIATDGIVNLVDVTTESEHLLKTGNGTATSDASGTLNVSGNSALTGDINHRGSTSDDTIVINLTDSTWDGAANASDDIGAIDITLVSSDWIITASSDTNGKVTADSDSNIDFREADENIVVEIDNLAGAPGLNIKLDDVLTINNPDAADSFQSSDPSVVEVVVDPDTGAVSIIPRSDGDAELTYSYIDETGKIQTVTIGVVSGAGSDPAGGGGGSSNCNSGVGAAMFALLGLAFVYKKK